jgi:ankyrin repeat protein
MPKVLPPRASLEWLKKTAKQNLPALRARDPGARLADVQRALARDHGFASWRALKAHVESRPDAAVPAEEEIAAFLLAVGEGEVGTVRAALAQTPALVDAVGPHPFWGGRPQPRHVAIETKRSDIFDLLLESGADVNGRNGDYDDWSPLMLALSGDRPDMRQALIERGARIGLAEALLMADDARVETLLRPGRSALPATGPNRGSILAFARTPFAIDLLLDLGAPAGMKDRWGSTPIDAMSRSGPNGRALVEHMIKRGIAAAPQDYARLNDRAALAAMIEADPGIVRSEAVMMGAVDFGHHDLALWLLDQGADPNARSDSESRHTALHSAAWNGDLAMAQLLAAAGADPSARDAQYDGTPRGWAETAITIANNPKCAKVAAWLEALAGPD